MPEYPVIMPDVQYMLDTNYSSNWPMWMQWAQDLGAGALNGLNYAIDHARANRAKARQQADDYWRQAEQNLSDYYGDEW
ncbi:MAG: SIMPL domain-containing protein [Clostridia bacterium]|nr:SIMPL domain-containing protein [Clostridia bacterium]